MRLRLSAGDRVYSRVFAAILLSFCLMCRSVSGLLVGQEPSQEYGQPARAGSLGQSVLDDSILCLDDAAGTGEKLNDCYSFS